MANTIRQRGDMLAEDRRAMPPARRKFIQEHRKHADAHGPDLPYQFGIFKPALGSNKRNIEFTCPCGYITYVASTTCSIICPACKSLQTVK